MLKEQEQENPSPQKGLRLHEGLLHETSEEVPHAPARGRPPSARKRDTVTLHPSHLYVPLSRGSRGRPPLPSPHFYHDFARCLLYAWHGLHQILYAYSPMSAHVFLFSVAINASNLLKLALEKHLCASASSICFQNHLRYIFAVTQSEIKCSSDPEKMVGRQHHVGARHFIL